MPSRILTLLKYKVLFFFGPSLRGRFGPAPYILLLILFGFYGFLAGYGIGSLLKSYTPTDAVNFLGAIFAGGLSFGLVFSLGTGVTAHASELDFVMTAPVKPREWLISDMLFQLTSVLMAGGLAGAVAAVGIVVSLGVSPVLAIVLLLLGGAFLLLMFMTIQILVILKIRYPKAHIGLITIALLILSLIPSISLVSPDFPLQFSGLPIPQTGFAELAHDILSVSAPAPEHLLYAFGWLAGIAAVWYALSNTYIFHGIKPTLSAGFGQVDLTSRMAQQRRITSALSGVTTTVKLRSETGGDVGFMTRLHLIRVWRDGSILFVVLLVFLFVVPSFFTPSSGDRTAQSSQASMQIMTLPIAILALNWSYYERENLWVVVTSGRSVVNYFRGMMVAFAVLVIGIAGLLVVLLQYATGAGLSASDLVLPVISPIVASIAATSMLTRVRIQPGAFSPAFLVVLLVTVIAGFGGGLAMQSLIAASPESLGAIGKLVELGLTAVLLSLAGEMIVGRLAKGFRFS